MKHLLLFVVALCLYAPSSFSPGQPTNPPACNPRQPVCGIK